MSDPDLNISMALGACAAEINPGNHATRAEAALCGAESVNFRPEPR